MLLAGLGVGALASQLGSVTVSSVPDEQSGEVGGLQNTVTNLGASIGTALAGAVLIAALTASFLTGVQNNPAVPERVKSKATTQLAGGVPFVSDNELKSALEDAHVPPRATDAIVEENETARLDGLRSSLSVLALIALLALFFSRSVPTDAAVRRRSPRSRRRCGGAVLTLPVPLACARRGRRGRAEGRLHERSSMRRGRRRRPEVGIRSRLPSGVPGASRSTSARDGRRRSTDPPLRRESERAACISKLQFQPAGVPPAPASAVRPNGAINSQGGPRR